MALAPTQRQQWLAMNVAQVLERWPSTARVFLRFRMACVGCDFSRFDMIGEALEVHGLEAEEFLTAVQAAIETDRTSPSGGKA
ncbi:MAG: DUF1858 domain-containing protein [Chloroflexota bacterium]